MTAETASPLPARVQQTRLPVNNLRRMGHLGQLWKNDFFEAHFGRVSGLEG
jgi:hypothetical protein